jgi:hypothetical protein
MIESKQNKELLGSNTVIQSIHFVLPQLQAQNFIFSFYFIS